MYRMEYIGRISREEYRRIWEGSYAKGARGKGERKKEKESTRGEKSKKDQIPRKRKIPRRPVVTTRRRLIGGKRGAKRYSRFRVPNTLQTYENETLSLRPRWKIPGERNWIRGPSGPTDANHRFTRSTTVVVVV